MVRQPVPPEACSDGRLLGRFLDRGDAAAFAVLLRRHGPAVLRVCRRLLPNRADADDAFQFTFLTLMRKGAAIRRRDRLDGWLCRVAFRAALRLRSKPRGFPLDPHAEIIDADHDPVTEVAGRELRLALETELSRLPAKYRSAMELYHLQGRSYEEIAEMLGCPKGTVAIRLLRARTMLKPRLLKRGLV